MKDTQLYSRLRAEVDKIRVVDTHEHIRPESERAKGDIDFFEYFIHYASSDLVSAGLSPKAMDEIRDPKRSFDSRWRAFEPYWKAARNTGYAKAIEISARVLFGVERITKGSAKKITEEMQKTKKPGWYKKVLKDVSNIEVSLLDCGTYDCDRTLFLPVCCVGDYLELRTREHLANIERQSKASIHTLDQLLRSAEARMDTWRKRGMAAIKIGVAYSRPILFQKRTRHEAEVAFNRLFSGQGNEVSYEEAIALQDYLAHKCVQLAVDAGVPIQIHTGIQEGCGNILTNSQPTLLLNLFMEYKDAKFDVFHAGYPYSMELGVMAKNFASVYADMCWMHIISPSGSRRILSEWLDLVPANKILGFGGDYVLVEGVPGHIEIARDNITRVLSRKVAEGYFSEGDAVRIARMILRDNAARLFGLSLTR
jgi:predicted TIM-barrel fold metal-dependent hydrolase